jgi:hypothetical protein
MGCLIDLIKLPFVLAAVLLEVAFALVGAVLSVLGALLTPVCGIGLLILPFGLAFLFLAWVIGKVL